MLLGMGGGEGRGESVFVDGRGEKGVGSWGGVEKEVRAFCGSWEGVVACGGWRGGRVGCQAREKGTAKEGTGFTCAGLACFCTRAMVGARHIRAHICLIPPHLPSPSSPPPLFISSPLPILPPPLVSPSPYLPLSSSASPSLLSSPLPLRPTSHLIISSPPSLSSPLPLLPSSSLPLYFSSSSSLRERAGYFNRICYDFFSFDFLGCCHFSH